MTATLEITYGTIIQVLDELGWKYKRVGSTYMGACPSCGRGYKTPNTSFNPELNSFYCFHCGASGGVKKFLELVGETSVKIKAGDYIPPPMDNSPKDITESIRPFITRKPDLDSYKYLTEERGLVFKNIQKYVRFLTPDKRWHYRKGFRLVFPSFDKEGRTRNAKIRNVFPEAKRKKLLETDLKVISWKGGENYTIGLNWIKPEDKFVLLVEGEMDFLTVKSLDPSFPVLALPSANYRLKPDEVKSLPAKVGILLDNDEAGEVNSFRLMKELEEEGKDVKVFTYPREKDFNDLLRANRALASRFLKDIQKELRG